MTTNDDACLSQNASKIAARREVLSIFNSLIEAQLTLMAASDTISEEQFTFEFG